MTLKKKWAGDYKLLSSSSSSPVEPPATQLPVSYNLRNPNSIIEIANDLRHFFEEIFFTPFIRKFPPETIVEVRIENQTLPRFDSSASINAIYTGINLQRIVSVIQTILSGQPFDANLVRVYSNHVIGEVLQGQYSGAEAASVLVKTLVFTHDQEELESFIDDKHMVVCFALAAIKS